MKKTFSLSEKLTRQLENIAKEQSTSQSQIVSEALVTYITLYKIGKETSDLIGDIPRNKKIEKQNNN